MTISIKGSNKRKLAKLAKQLSRGSAESPARYRAAQTWRGFFTGLSKIIGISQENCVSNDAPVTEAAQMKAQLAMSFQPVSRAVLIAGAVYFAFVVAGHFYTEDTLGFLLLGSIASILSVSCLALYSEFRRRQLTFGQLEFRAFIVFALIFLSLVAHHSYHIEPSKLIYFTFVAMTFAMTSVSVRIIVLANILSLAATYYFAARAGAEVFEQYAFVGIAGITVSFCLASLMRAAITREIRARLLADTLRGSAETISDSDMLTGLPNRRHFFRELKSCLAAVGNRKKFALAIGDLDGFKPINDTFGHSVGDKLLFEVGQRLKKACGDDCFIARLGGDEFAIIVYGNHDADSLQEFGERVRKEVRRPYEIIGIKMSVSISIGFVFENQMALVESELMERADYALYRAKELKCGVVTYSQQHEIDRRNENAVEYTLRNSDLASEMHVAFQPQIDIDRGLTRGFEALARWSSSELGFVPPDVFIRAAERTGIMEDLTPILLQKALAGAAEWPDGLILSFNLSVRDIDSPASISKICQVVRESGFPPERIEFEVTETLVMTDFKKAQKSLRVLRRLGSQIALDDFGVGYTNFERIDQLHVSTVKIDRAFIQRLDEPGRSGKVISAMVQLCDALGISNVVEGVENERQLAAVRAAGAKIVQGYYFSSPMIPQDVPAYLMREQATLVGDRSAGCRTAAG